MLDIFNISLGSFFFFLNQSVTFDWALVLSQGMKVHTVEFFLDCSDGYAQTCRTLHSDPSSGVLELLHLFELLVRNLEAENHLDHQHHVNP